MAPLAAGLLAVAGCRGDREAGQTPAAAPAADAGTAAGAPATQPQGPAAAGPAPVRPVEDSIREAREDSIALATDFHQRTAAMESYASCMTKARAAEPPQRAVLQAACARARGAAR